ncbi:BON domain-containing protein [Nocardia inohanensis]|uniref:BON domain-containing protein n=1 Tax=Nocardia inohanensis TaxID=209246 RepID=UPI00082F6CC3|nr:BON domain-containing protein [Nocardia inohanensis]
MNSSSAFLLARLRRLLAEDEPAGPPEIEVSVRGRVVVLAGEVTSPCRRARMENLVREMLPRIDIRNEIRVRSPELPYHP